MEHPLSSSPLQIITPDNPDYEYWNSRSANVRMKGQPAQIIPIQSIEELTTALQQTVDGKHRLAIRGGGHCLENFVSDAAVEVIIDISRMKGIRYDDVLNAIEIHAGVTLGEMHEKLYHAWGIVLPTGEHPAIGIGGHIQGGAFGFLCRQHGLGADHLYAVEMLWVNENGQVEKTLATREDADPNRELWWAHTGGGAGNFGVVTRFWFRSPGVEGTNPSILLPPAPTLVVTAELEWAWKDLDEKNFQLLVSNFGEWAKQNSPYDPVASSIFATLHLWQQVTGKIQLKAVLIDPIYAEEALRDLLRALGKGLHVPYQLVRKELSWLDFALRPFPDVFTDDKGSFKVKDAFLVEPFSAEQIKVIYQHLTSSKNVPGGFVAMATYGGKVNTVAPDATASAQRNAILDTSCTAGWMDAADEASHTEWARQCYAEVFQNTGGVPVPGEQYGGCMIPHPDNDMADSAYNKSGVPWYTFYYQDNYPRLQQVKAKWDPLNIFKHALSVQADI